MTAALPTTTPEGAIRTILDRSLFLVATFKLATDKRLEEKLVDVVVRTIHTSVPRKLQVHLIVDSCGTHTHPDVKTWLAKHPRFHLHFTPTSSSWLTWSSAGSAN